MPVRTCTRPDESALLKLFAAETAAGHRQRKEKGVALRVHLNPAFGDARLPDDVSMLGERVRVRLLAELVE